LSRSRIRRAADITLADQGMVHMDTAPAAPFGAGTTYSLFQSDMVGVRVVLDVSWAVISTSGVALMNSVSW